MSVVVMNDLIVEAEVRGDDVSIFADTNDGSISVCLHSKPRDNMDTLVIRAPEGLIMTEQTEHGCGCGKERQIVISLKASGQLVSMLRAVAMTAQEELLKQAETDEVTP